VDLDLVTVAELLGMAESRVMPVAVVEILGILVGLVAEVAEVALLLFFSTAILQ
jgi:hypothetical protein